LRDWFRSSFSHNTITIDNQSSSEPGGPFSWKSIAKCSVNSWISQQRFDYVAGQHDGYQRLSESVTHLRSILFLKLDYWIMFDQLRMASEHLADVWFHFAASARPMLEATTPEISFITERENNAGLDIYCFGDGQWRRKEAWVSQCYGQKELARAYAFSALLSGNGEIVTFFLPQQLERRFQVREIEAIGGRAFELAHDNGLDVVMIRTGKRVETARLASDFEWTWTRFRQDVVLPLEFVLLSGTSLEFEGRKILQSGRLINYLAGSRQGDEFRVESDDSALDLGSTGDVAWRFANLSRESAI
jgi:Heparinase II/III-like protein